MRLVRWIFALCLTLSSSMFMSAALAGFGGANLRIVHTFPADHPVHLRLKEMLPELQEASDYTVRFELYSADEVGGWRQIVRGLDGGRYDFVLSRADLLAANGIDIGPLGRSDLFIDFSTWKNLPESSGEDAVKELFAESDLDFLGAAWLSSDYLVAQTNVEDLSDLQGLIVRTPSDTMSSDLYKMLGMEPVTIGLHETFLAMERGMVDAAVLTASGSYWTTYWDTSAKLTGHGNTLISDPVGGQVAWLVARNNWQEKLDDFTASQVKKVLGEAMLRLGTDLHASQQNLLKSVSQKGATLTHLSDQDRDQMINAVQEAWRTNFSPRDRSIAERMVGSR